MLSDGTTLPRPMMMWQVRGLDEAGDGLVSLDEWCAGLPHDLPESEPCTQEELGALSLRPLDVAELRVDAPIGPPRGGDPLPPQVLHKFKFKLVAQRQLTCIWSTKNTSASYELSLWAPELDATPLSRRSKAKICLGHACANSIDAPSKGHSPIVLEVVDSSVLLGASEHLPNLIEQLLPPPSRYRLAWHSLQHTPPLYLWRAVPPSAQFVALGMLATTSDEPPAMDAMRCVPKRWCERQASPCRLLWRDDGQGGRPGSFWAVPSMELVVAGQGAEPPEEALSSWALKESKITTDTWLLSQ